MYIHTPVYIIYTFFFFNIFQKCFSFWYSRIAALLNHIKSRGAGGQRSGCVGGEGSRIPLIFNLITSRRCLSKVKRFIIPCGLRIYWSQIHDIHSSSVCVCVPRIGQYTTLRRHWKNETRKKWWTSFLLDMKKKKKNVGGIWTQWTSFLST